MNKTSNVVYGLAICSGGDQRVVFEFCHEGWIGAALETSEEYTFQARIRWMVGASGMLNARE